MCSAQNRFALKSNKLSECEKFFQRKEDNATIHGLQQDNILVHNQNEEKDSVTASPPNEKETKAFNYDIYFDEPAEEDYN